MTFCFQETTSIHCLRRWRWTRTTLNCSKTWLTFLKIKFSFFLYFFFSLFLFFFVSLFLFSFFLSFCFCLFLCFFLFLFLCLFVCFFLSLFFFSLYLIFPIDFRWTTLQCPTPHPGPDSRTSGTKSSETPNKLALLQLLQLLQLQTKTCFWANPRNLPATLSTTSFQISFLLLELSASSRHLRRIWWVWMRVDILRILASKLFFLRSSSIWTRASFPNKQLCQVSFIVKFTK